MMNAKYLIMMPVCCLDLVLKCAPEILCEVQNHHDSAWLQVLPGKLKLLVLPISPAHSQSITYINNIKLCQP